jgi:hypothetical protein
LSAIKSENSVPLETKSYTGKKNIFKVHSTISHFIRLYRNGQNERYRH